MTPFKFSIADNPTAAIAALTKNDHAAFLGGGTNLLDLMKEHVTNPTEIVDLGKLAFKEIKNTSSGISLGALAKNTDTANHPTIRKDYPLLSKAILAGASAQIRNMATNGGNLLQRTRCSYFYDIAMPCNKRQPGSGCAAIDGFNRMHAVFGWSDKCVAVYPSDMAVALSALNASVKVMAQNSTERTIAIHDFHLLPNDHPEKDNSLKHGELITSIEIPKNNFAEHSAYIKVRDRNSYAFALVSVAVGLEMNGNVIKAANISMGGVAHKPWRATNAEQALVGKAAVLANFEKAAEAEMRLARPLSHNKFKIEMGKNTLINALEAAYKG
ncbi:FAD binding domain-containing protein [Pedobacter endophyticus]|uniref:Xanthine dehydrogenase family protein subunit M n=1 Tax=Pedobacter endophyticus TaxID=2789740 RepID=A0A7S9PZE0_9SPHI|nr:xanthine dehydrogenase family protein subunit M [Pedobacter endophyticus]QPH39547.1 xanthine dehydrogenase family protein subunit M [Pedobacter endophyticus]